MEVKKSAKADLQGKKFMFTQIGLIVSLLLLYGIFNVHSNKVEVEVVQKVEEAIITELPPVTRPDEPTKPRVEKVVAPTISEKFEVVENTVELEDSDIFNPEADEDTPTYGGVKTGVPNEGDYIPDEEIPVFKAEISPNFQNGGEKSLEKFRQWVQKNVKYPAIAQENGVTGVVNLKFIIGSDGVVKNIETLTNPDRSLTDEVVRVMKSSPKWTPGKQREKPVPVIATIRIVFTL